MSDDINRVIRRGWMASASFFALFMLPAWPGRDG
jgi:hypothetical protein